jgi:hypothetical protein
MVSIQNRKGKGILFLPELQRSYSKRGAEYAFEEKAHGRGGMSETADKEEVV